jgi:hypothetical protein
MTRLSAERVRLQADLTKQAGEFDAQLDALCLYVLRGRRGSPNSGTISISSHSSFDSDATTSRSPSLQRQGSGSSSGSPTLGLGGGNLSPTLGLIGGGDSPLLGLSGARTSVSSTSSSSSTSSTSSSSSSASASPVSPVQKKTRFDVLLVEDVKVSQKVAKMSLKKLNYKVAVADNGPQAVTRYRDFIDSLRIVLMDINLVGGVAEKNLPRISRRSYVL